MNKISSNEFSKIIEWFRTEGLSADKTLDFIEYFDSHTDSEISQMINWFEAEGFSAGKILEFIKYVFDGSTD